MRDSGKPKYLDGKRDLTYTQEAGFWKTNLGVEWGIFFACQCQEFRKSLFVHLSFFRFFPSASSYWGGKALIQTDIQNINRKGQSTSYTVISFCSTGLFSAGSKPWDKEGPGLPKKMFRPFGPQFGPKIRWEGGGGRPPRSPPLSRIRHCFLNLSILETKNGIRETDEKSVEWIIFLRKRISFFQTLNTVPFAHKEGASVTWIIRSTEGH